MNNDITAKPELKGYLALVLHAHLPYWGHQRQSDDLGEQLFYKTMTETFLPLIEGINRLLRDNIDFRITIAMSPTLLTLFSDPRMQEMYRAYLGMLIGIADADQVRLPNNPAFLSTANRYSERIRELQLLYESCNGNVIAIFKQYQESGHIEIVTSTATHGFLPFMKTEEAMKAQILTAVRDYERHFDQKPRGIWLPECGYTPGIDRILKQAGIHYFFTDSTAVAFATPRPTRKWAAPLMTPYGVTAFPLEPESASYMDQANHFLGNFQNKIEDWAQQLDRKPILVSPCHMKLLGHWLYEGPHHLELLCRKIFFEQNTVKMITPCEYLEEFPISDVGQLNESGWGIDRSGELRLPGHHEWIYRHLHQAEERMIRLATKHEHLLRHGRLSANVLKRALNQAARELILAQSNDWADKMDSPFASFAIRRTKDHLGCFHHLCDQMDRGQVDELLLAALEDKDNCFPTIQYQDYISIQRLSPIPMIPNSKEWETLLEETKHRPNVFMLTWEYPPKHVGGLSKAVHELSEALANHNEIVHVVTTSVEGAPAFEKMNGVYVHRLPVDHSGDTSFYHWAFEMNLAMTDYLVRWKENGGRIDLLHAHDWMVTHAAREIKISYGIPLVATIHATEWGRNQGNLYSDLQRKIHHLEWKLTYEANRIFVCSSYMKEEVVRIFNLPSEKVSVHPNGIQAQSQTKERVSRPELKAKQDKIIFYIGRLVYEKGIQLLIDAMPKIISQVPQAKLIIAGSGPMEESLRSKSAYLGERISFTGFVQDEYRQQLYQAADVCVIPSLYEPFGIVALEAMANRKPIVLSDTGGLAEIIRHGVDGYKALPGHVDSLAWHITEMLLNPEQAAKMANSAFELLQKHYDWSNIASNILEEYHKLTYYQAAIQV